MTAARTIPETVLGRPVLLLPPKTGAPRAVVLFLHGTGGTAAWAVEEARMADFADAYGVLVVAPEAAQPDPAAPPKFLTNPPRWNDGSASAVPEMTSHADDVAFLDAALDDAAGKFPTAPRRAGVFGFSNGAGMAFRYAAERAGRVACVVPVAGHCWIDPAPARPVPTLYTIGDRDPLVPPRGGEVALPWGNRIVKRPAVAAFTLEKWAAANGCDTVPVAESDAAGVRVDAYRGPVEMKCVSVAGLGHHWPGGLGRLNPRLGGPVVNSFDLNPAAAAFVLRHTE